ncbi:hypothetical protein ElyMa_002890800 [Elysia marginata]|uniref:Uncharacterized protein n=1 Tax=Elysia marginata TaxID=1093978 RepID=A0AAV4I0P7_9GAST|nr:hypothetical protein ElyMa_002890800 [Elysia marginata]
MTFENGGSLQSSPSATRRLPSKMHKRAKLTNSLLAQASEDNGDGPLPQTNVPVHKKFEASNNSRRSSCSQVKSLISPVYREKLSPRPKIAYKDLSLTYPTPELQFDFSQYEQVSQDNSAHGINNVAKPPKNAQGDSDVTNRTNLPHTNRELGGKNTVASAHPHWRNALLSLRNNRRFSLPVTSLEKQLENALTFVAQIPKEKNEAEIIDGPRRGSLEDSVSFSVPGAAVLKLQGRNTGGVIGRSASLKVGRGESLNRELRSHYMNSMQERKLRSACDELDRQSYAGVLEHKSRQQQIQKGINPIAQISRQHAEILRRSPSTKDWMSSRKCRTASLQERERESISRRFSRRVRHFRAPKALQEEVGAIRSVAMFHAGLYDAARSPPASPTEAKMLLRRIATIAGGGGVPTDTGNLSRGNSRRNSRGGEDDRIISLVSDENAEIHNSFAAKNRSSVSGGETSAALRHLHSSCIPPRVAESGLAGLLNHSRRMSLVGVPPTVEDMLHGLPDYLTGNGNNDSADTDTATTPRSCRRLSTFRGVSSMADEVKPTDEEIRDEDESESIKDFQTKEGDDLSDSESDIDPFSDLDQISSDTDGEGDDNAFEDDRRNL